MNTDKYHEKSLSLKETDLSRNFTNMFSLTVVTVVSFNIK